MQHILIIEDNTEQLNMLIDTINNRYPSWKIDYAASYDETLILIKNSIEKHNFNLFLLDVQLSENSNNRDGFLLAKEIRNIPIYYRTSILFLTGITEASSFALSNFHCYNYITKPYSGTDTLNQLEQMLLTGYLEKIFTITDTNRITHKIRGNDIIYVHSKRHLKTIYLKDSHINTRDYKMDEIINLCDGELIMCQKSYLINPRYISSIDKLTKSVIVSGISIPVGKKYIDHLLSYMEISTPNNHKKGNT